MMYVLLRTKAGKPHFSKLFFVEFLSQFVIHKKNFMATENYFSVFLSGQEYEMTMNCRFEHIYKRYSSYIFKYTSKYIYDKHDAENITQDTFLTFLETIDRFDDAKDPLPYLYTISRNKCITYLRRKTVANSYTQYTMEQKKDYLNLILLKNESQTDIYGSDIRGLLQKALRRMPPKVRDTYILSRTKNLKNSELAKHLGISTRGVEERLKKAMLELRKTFEDYL